MILNMERLPRVVPVGIQTESGVEAIGFDLLPWLKQWPEMSIAVWPTRPGESASYIAADTEMVGNVLYWYPNAADTEKEGAGTVEVVGISGGKRKSSGVIDTLVKKTSLDVTQETPEPIKPWFDSVLQAANEIKENVDVGKGGLYLVNAIPIPGEVVKADRSQEEVREAVKQGKTVLLVDYNGKVYTYMADQAMYAGAAVRPTFYGGVIRKAVGGNWQYQIEYRQIGEDQTINISTSAYFKAANPEALTIEQDGETSAYDGSNAVKIKIPNPVTDEHINSLIDQKLAGSGGSHTILAETTAQGEDGMLFIATPPVSMPVVGSVYTVTFNGAPYDCLALSAEEEGVEIGVVLGNTDVAGVPGGNPDAPFVVMLAHEPQNMDGTMMYGMVMVMDGVTSATISIEGEGGSSNSTPQIILTIDKDGNVTSDTPFGTAWAMTPGELQAAIVIKESSNYKGETIATVDAVSKAEGGLVPSMFGGRMINLRIRKAYLDVSDLGDKDTTRFLTWVEGGVIIATEQSYSLPVLPVGQQSYVGRYARYNGSTWDAVTIDQLKADLGLT